MCCAAVRGWVVQGVLSGGVGSPGVVVVYGRVRSRWCDVHRPAPRGRRRSRSRRVVSSLGHGGRGTPVARVWLRVAAAGPVAGCGSGSWGFLMRRTRALWRVLRISCSRAVCAARAPVSVRMAGCRRSPSARAQIRQIALFDNTPAVIALAVGPACMAGPCARPLVDPLRGRGGSGGMTGPGVALPPFPVAGGSGGSGKCGPRPGDVGGSRWGFIRV